MSKTLGLDENKIIEISKIKKEPKWMTDFRLNSYKAFREIPNPNFGPELKINFDLINYYKRVSEKTEKSWDKVDCNVKNTFEELGLIDAEKKYLDGIGAQCESEVVYHSMIKELEDKEKYKKLKGVYLHKQVYDILLEANGGENVTYYELSSIIRYDKNLRDTLYIYLATAEEYLRALLCEKYDVAAECKPFEHHCYKPLIEALCDKDDETSSNLYFKLEPDFSALMDVCIDKGVISISKTTKQRIKDLRNSTMHHSLLIFGKATKPSALNSHFEALENRINALMQILPEEYRAGFITSIKKLNGYPSKQYLTKYYLEIQDDKICISKWVNSIQNIIW